MGKCTLHHVKGWRLRLTGLVLGVAAWSLVVGAGAEVLAADSTLSNDFRLWTPVFLTAPISQSFIGYAEVNPRLGDDVSDLNQLILRTALGYKLSETWSVWQGYAWNTVYDNAANKDEFTGEHRIYQQLTYKDKFEFLEAFPFIKIQSRSRLEERWIDHIEGTALRARTMLRVDVPLPQLPDWSFVTFEEIFFNLNGLMGNKGVVAPEAGFDQNRWFIGFNRQFTKQINVDFGYQMQIVNTRRDQLVNQINNCIMINLFINL